jgi:hypothetical protein
MEKLSPNVFFIQILYCKYSESLNLATGESWCPNSKSASRESQEKIKYQVYTGGTFTTIL